jgi:hypothetical protein
MLYLHLVDAGQLVFHGVFHRDDLGFRGVERVQGSVERGGFARTGGPGDQHHAGGMVNEAFPLAEMFRVEAQLAEPEQKPTLVQDTHDQLSP